MVFVQVETSLFYLAKTRRFYLVEDVLELDGEDLAVLVKDLVGNVREGVGSLQGQLLKRFKINQDSKRGSRQPAGAAPEKIYNK